MKQKTSMSSQKDKNSTKIINNQNGIGRRKEKEDSRRMET